MFRSCGQQPTKINVIPQSSVIKPEVYHHDCIKIEKPSRASRSINRLDICSPTRAERIPQTQEKKKTRRKTLDIWEKMCVQNVMKINASSSKRGQQKIISWTHRRLDVGRTRSIDMAEGISELSLLPGKEGDFCFHQGQQLNRPRIAMLQRGAFGFEEVSGSYRWNPEQMERSKIRKT